MPLYHQGSNKLEVKALFLLSKIENTRVGYLVCCSYAWRAFLKLWFETASRPLIYSETAVKAHNFSADDSDIVAYLASKNCFCLLGFGKDLDPLPSSATGTPMYSNCRTSCLLPLLVRIAKFFGEGPVSVFSGTFLKGLTVLIQRRRLYIVSSSSLKYPGRVGSDHHLCFVHTSFR